jgi:hypothetical protein
LLGATAAGVVVAVRALPPVQRRMWAAQKPWACDICMSFWTTGLVALLAAAWRQDEALVILCGPAYPWALWVLRKITDPHGPPPLPELEDTDGT